MRLPNTAHTSRPWRIHELTRDFQLEEVWALPTPGGRDDFPRLVQLMATFDPSQSSSGAVRTLFAIRWKIGALLGWDRAGGGHRPERATLRERLPEDLREARAGPDAHPFTSLYLTDDEWAAEIINRTVYGVMHVGWVPDKTGGYCGQLAVLVKPNGLLGTGYMAAIAPFRHLIVYPRMMREIGRRWGRAPATHEPSDGHRPSRPTAWGARTSFRPPTCRGDEANGAPPVQLSRCVVPIHVTDDAQEKRPSGPSGERRWAVLYDAGCGFCTWLLSFVLRWDRAARLHPIALGRPEADDLLQALTPAERMASWHLISHTGERRSGGAAVAALLRVLPGGRLPAAGLARCPRLTDRGYRWVAEHRSQLSRRVPSSVKHRASQRVHQREHGRETQ